MRFIKSSRFGDSFSILESVFVDKRVISVILFLILSMTSLAQSVSITRYSVDPGIISPSLITFGPDGAIWYGGNDSIVRFSLDGKYTTFPIGSQYPIFDCSQFSSASDGGLWFVGNGNNIGHITTSGVVTGYKTSTIVDGAPYGCFQSTVAGPDGALWIVEHPDVAFFNIGRLTTSGQLTEWLVPRLVDGFGPLSQGGQPAAGPDGAIWFPEGHGRVGRITTSGSITHVTLPLDVNPGSLAWSRDGALWFCDYGGGTMNPRIDRLAVDGTLTKFSIQLGPDVSWGGLIAGPDGAMWFLAGSYGLGRIAANGTVNFYAADKPAGLTVGPDNALWFTEDHGLSEAHTIGRAVISGSTPLGITTKSLPSATMFAPYSQMLTATGGTSPYIWSATSLPAGLTLSSVGILSGTPTSAGTSNPAFTVNDSAPSPQLAKIVLSLTVNNGLLPAPLTITSLSVLPGGLVGTAYSLPLSAKGGVAPYAWSISTGALPLGLTLDPVAGIISGMPTASGTSNFTIQVKDSSSTNAILAATLAMGAAGSVAPRTGVISQVASGAGWKTSIYLINSTSSLSNVTVNFWSDAGGALSLPLTVTGTGGTRTSTAANITESIGAYSTLLIESASSSAPGLSGWAEVVGATALKGYVVFHYTSSSGVESEGTVPLETNYQPSFLMPYDNVGGISLGVALANLSQSKATTIAVTIWDENGVKLSGTTFGLAAGGHTSFMLTDRVAAATANRGFLQFTSMDGPDITGLGLRMNPAGGFTSVPKL